VPIARLEVTIGKTTTVLVDGWPLPASPFSITTSTDLTLPQRSEWPTALRGLIVRRSRRGGVAKGRILRCVQSGGPLKAPIVVGMLAFSFSAKNLVVVGLGCARFKHDAEASQIEALMLSCAQEIARKLGRDCIRWKLHGPAAVKHAEGFGFKRLGRSSARHRSDRGAILMERCRQPETEEG
jgi:hypothetical protein